ncbi:unnamed protein product, partial [marine sediment metagenome]
MMCTSKMAANVPTLLFVLCLAPFATASPATPDEIGALIANSDFTAAESKARELLADVEATHGPDSLDAAHVLDLLVEALWRGGHASGPDTLDLARRAVAIKEEERGPWDAEVAVSLRNLGTVLEYSGDPESAQRVYERAINIVLKTRKTDSVQLAIAYIDLA